MSSKLSARPLNKSCIAVGLLMAAILFDGGNSLVGLVVKSEGLVWGAHAASSGFVAPATLRSVMPDADSFSDKEGEVPVYKAYRDDPPGGEKELIGYVYLTDDVPPIAKGYSGSIDVLLGVDLKGNVTGLKVMSYRESLRNTWGDFLAMPGFQEQFVGKHVTDNFRVNYDVDGIVKATISVRAMAKGIRTSIRQVATAYLQ